MPNAIGLAGGNPGKPTKYAPIFTSRFYSGLWTNRSPLRDANTSRIVEKFYGAAGDALIAGSNTEITNRLTLARRPGTSAYDSHSYDAPKRFYDFHVTNPSTEEIIVMIDQADGLYSSFGGAKSLVYSKSEGAGQSYMQSVGNILYWGDGVDNKKWLQTLFIWTANASWNTSTTPPFTTYIIDPNGNIQQLNATAVPVTNISVSSNVLTVTSSESLTSILSAGMYMSFPENMSAVFLENQTVTIVSVSGDTFTANFTAANYTGTETNVYSTQVNGGTNPVGAATEPTWSTVVPSATNNFQGGITQDGQVSWTNRGNPVENWGIQPPINAPSISVGTSNVAWSANTFYSLVSVIVDSNGNLQQATTAGKSGSTQPTWATSVGATTTDGVAVWTMIQTAASLVWQPNTQYTQSILLNLTSVSAASGGDTDYRGAIALTDADAAAFVGKSFVVSGWTNIVNNGTFECTAATASVLTLNNANGVAETNAGTALLQGSFVIGNAAGTNCLFTLAQQTQPTITGNVSAYLYAGAHSGPVGQFTLKNPTSTGSALASYTTLNSFSFTGTPLSSGASLAWEIINAAGASTGTVNPFPSYTENYQLIILGSLNVAVAGTYTFTIKHHDGLIWGIGNGATGSGTSDNPIGQTVTAAQGYAVIGGTNIGLEGGAVSTDTFSVTFPVAGVYPVEIDYAYWYHSGQQMIALINGFPIANTGGGGQPESGANEPIWPSWTVTYAPNYPTVTESNGQLTWTNIGPVTDFAWAASTTFTLPDTTIIDPNGYEEAPYRTGITGTAAPAFATGANQLTYDGNTLIWINEGIASIPKTGTLSTFNGGWQYGIALVNTLDNTVSNIGRLTAATGNFIGIDGVQIAAGSGLPNPAVLDPQADYVAIFRTTDGKATPFLIPSQIPQVTVGTLPLSTYLTDGYLDTTPDTGLNELISAPENGENTPPAAGAKNLAYHLNRLWYSVGTVVYYTSGPDTPAGNGLNGTAPLNFDTMAALVTRIVPTSAGAMVFTISDTLIIQGNGTSSSPIQGAVIILPGIGLLSYNALDLNGPTIGLFTTDNNFIILDPSSGVTYAGLPINDQLSLNNGSAGTSWDPSNVYVAWHVQGLDQAWYLCDGTNGWFRLMSTPSPETGYTWSPFATIAGGAGAVQSIEVTPGVHRLLIGPAGTGSILERDLTVFTDNGTPYAANATIGSIVLAQPGQVAQVSYIVTESVRRGTPLNLGILVDEALPYYTGPVDILKQRVNDPPNLKSSRSIYSERFYLSVLQDDTAVMRHCQVQIVWSNFDEVQNELLTMTVFGSYSQEA